MGKKADCAEFNSQGIAIDVAIDVAIRQLKITHILNVTKAGAKSLALEGRGPNRLRSG